MSGLRKFKTEVEGVVSCLQGFLDGSKTDNVLPFSENFGTKVTTIEHAKALLPLCDLVGTAWRHARLQGGSSLALASDVAFSWAGSVVPPLNDSFDINLLLDARLWNRGERLRLLAPLAALLEHAAAPGGIQALPLDDDAAAHLKFKINQGGCLDYKIILSAADFSVYKSEVLKEKIQHLGAGDTELQVACRAGFSKEKRIAAAWGLLRALGRASPAVGSVSDRLRISMWCQADPDTSPPAELEDSARLFVSVAEALAKRPAELGKLNLVMANAGTHLALLNARSLYGRGLPAVRDMLGAPAAQAALLKMAQSVRDFIVEASPTDVEAQIFWFCTALVAVQPPRAWLGEEGGTPPTAIMKALREATDAFNHLMAHDAVNSKTLEDLAELLLGALRYAAMGVLKDSGIEEMYLLKARYTPSDYAIVMAAIQALMAGAQRTAMPAVSLRFLLSIFPLHCIPTMAENVSWHDATMIMGAVIDLFKFMLGLAPHEQDLEASRRALFIWFCSVSFIDACYSVICACDTHGSETPGKEKGVCSVRVVAAAALKLLRVVSQESRAMKALFLKGKLKSLYEDEETVKGVLDGLSFVLANGQSLAPALMEADAKGLNVIVEILSERGMAGENVGKLRALAAATGGKDPQDEPTAVARAHLLAELDCAYLGCSNVRPGASRAGKRCTGCLHVTYCSVECQRADWRSHSLACKAIKAESEA